MVRILSQLGIRRVRITGGEPLVRKGLPKLIHSLRQISGIEEVLLTTNGVLLPELAGDLREAGLTQINIHLDTLNPEKFNRITRLGDIGRVFAGMRAAQRAGFSPIKLNAVIQKGINDEDVEDLLYFAGENGFILRLIELMPIGEACRLPEAFVPLEVIRRRLERKYRLIPLTSPLGAGPAVYYRIVELKTDVGFISPVSQPFCKSCDRIRISSEGRFQDCLAYDGRFSLRDLLRNPAFSDEDIAQEIVNLLQGKREDHNNFVQEKEIATPCKYGIGG